VLFAEWWHQRTLDFSHEVWLYGVLLIHCAGWSSRAFFYRPAPDVPVGVSEHTVPVGNTADKLSNHVMSLRRTLQLHWTTDKCINPEKEETDSVKKQQINLLCGKSATTVMLICKRRQLIEQMEFDFKSMAVRTPCELAASPSCPLCYAEWHVELWSNWIGRLWSNTSAIRRAVWHISERTTRLGQ